MSLSIVYCVYQYLRYLYLLYNHILLAQFDPRLGTQPFPRFGKIRGVQKFCCLIKYIRNSVRLQKLFDCLAFRNWPNIWSKLDSAVLNFKFCYFFVILCIWDIQQNNSIIGGIYRISWIFRLYICMSVSQCVCNSFQLYLNF